MVWEKHYVTSGLKKNVLFGGKCNFENVMYKATIFLMENRKDIKKLLWNFWRKWKAEVLLS